MNIKYFVVSDIHGFYSLLLNTLAAKGFERNNTNHHLIICGDAFDRGKEAKQLQDFLVQLYEENRLIYIRGNHEDLLMQMVNELPNICDHIEWTHHASNGTLSTLAQLTGMTISQIKRDPLRAQEYFSHTLFVEKLLPNMVDYAEIDDYIFVHGWIPCTNNPQLAPYHIRGRNYLKIDNWRLADENAWKQARWVNGQEMALIHNIIEPEKTIVCGHWHCSWGHAIERGVKPDEYECFYGDQVNFAPFSAKGVLAIDACTAYTQKINCVIIEN